MVYRPFRIPCDLPLDLMISPLRPITAAILCVMTLIGPSAGWLHVVTCSTDQPAIATRASLGHVHAIGHREAGPAAESSGHACCRHRHAPSAPADASDCPDTPRHHHDSDDCAICHWIASAVATPIAVDVPANTPLMVCDAAVAEVPAKALPTLSLMRLRGPPAC